MIRTYIKKPKAVKGVRWTGENVKEVVGDTIIKDDNGKLLVLLFDFLTR